MTRPPKPPYSKVVRTTWGDEKFRRLSPLKPSGQALWLYLLTGPHCTVIPGLYPKMGIGTLGDALQWPTGAVARAWAEIQSAHMAESDWAAGVIWLPKAIEHNDPVSPNVVTTWRTVPLPQCELVIRALRAFRIYLESKDNPTWAEAFDEAFRKAFPEAFGDAMPESRSRARTGSNTPLPPTGVGDAFRSALRILRQDRSEAKRVREHAGGCPHDPTCETYSICIEHIAVAIAIRRHEVRQRAC